MERSACQTLLPKHHFPSVKHLTLGVSVTQKHIVHTDTQAHICSHTVTPHASLNTMETWPTSPCHLVKNNSFCNRLWLCSNNSVAGLWSAKMALRCYFEVSLSRADCVFWLHKVGRNPKMSHPFFYCAVIILYIVRVKKSVLSLSVLRFYISGYNF